MGIEAKLALRQTQKLVMTAMLQQAIKLLPMSRLELVQVIRQELTENPMLEEVALAEDGDTPAEDEEGEGVTDPASEGVMDAKELMDLNWDDYFPEEWEWKGLPYEEYEEKFSYENTIRTPTTLSAHLTSQLMMSTDDEMVRQVGVFLIGNIDEEGYLRCDLDEAMAATQAERATVERVLSLIQSFDPTGVGGRDLRECLLIQIRFLGLEGSLVETIVSEYLPTLEARGAVHITDVAKELTKTLNLSPDEVAMALRILKHLDPQPGLCFAAEPSEVIIPDVIVMKVGEDYQIFLNDDGIPRLRISSTYKSLLRGGQMSQPEAKQYLEEKLRSALWLIRSIEQRRQTLYKVANSIVTFQREFLDHGLSYLKPLVLKDVAEDIGMHESTVSRVTTRKYMHTEQGIFELKYFFHSGIESNGGPAISSLTVKDRIKKLVAAEEPNKPLTDQQIVAILARENVKIARRTVTKYRRELKLPPANRRKRMSEVRRV
ncbi:MAG: RNA polymerase factor sigma-54 [Nitrospinae bacterium]|nr:RNA polymerase factor sigma-54 [Nitrospinota bacterium]